MNALTVPTDHRPERAAVRFGKRPAGFDCGDHRDRRQPLHPGRTRADAPCSSVAEPGRRARHRWPPLASLIVALSAIAVVCSCLGSTDSGVEGIRRRGVLRIGTDPMDPPFASLDPQSGELRGFDIDLGRALAADVGAVPEFVIAPRAELPSLLRQGGCDVLLAALDPDASRNRKLGFTRPYAASGVVAVVSATGPSWSGAPGAAAGKKVGCRTGTAAEQELRRLAGVHVVEARSYGEVFQALESGSADAVAVDLAVALAYVGSRPHLAMAAPPLLYERYAAAVRPGDSALQEELNSALQRLQRHGELTRLHARWELAPPGGADGPERPAPEAPAAAPESLAVTAPDDRTGTRSGTVASDTLGAGELYPGSGLFFGSGPGDSGRPQTDGTWDSPTPAPPSDTDGSTLTPADST